jgi:mannose-6-phosphate isomerase class I
MILRFQPLFFTKIWGGSAIRRRFDFPLSQEGIGECWGISALPGKETPVREGPFAGITLSELWTHRPEWFGHHPAPFFPLLVKFIDASQDLSVQVHPDDAYARQKGFPYGKHECWIVLGAEPGSEIVFGHSAGSRAELEEKIAQNRIEDVLRRVPVHEGDFFNVSPGTIHALGKGLLILEIQQSSDLTYRLYDYHRLENGKPRELHVEDALNTLHFPDPEPSTAWGTPVFSIDRPETGSEQTASRFGDYLIAVSGEGTIDGERVRAGEFFMATSLSKYRLDGSLSLYRARLQ